MVDFVPIALRALPWAAPGVVVSVLLGCIWTVWRRRRAGLQRAIAEALLLAWVGSYVSITLTPGQHIEFGQSRSLCGVILLSPIGIGALHGISDRVLNLLLCIPAGFMALASTRVRTGWITAVIALPIAAELIQYLAPVLGRACQLSDIQDNWQGALIGAALGGLIAFLRWLRTRAPKQSAAVS